MNWMNCFMDQIKYGVFGNVFLGKNFFFGNAFFLKKCKKVLKSVKKC